MTQTSMLMGMFLDVCTDEERSHVNSLLRKNLHGPDEVLAVRVIRRKWVELLNRDYHKSKAVDTNEKSDPSLDEFNIPRFSFTN